MHEKENLSDIEVIRNCDIFPTSDWFNHDVNAIRHRPLDWPFHTCPLLGSMKVAWKTCSFFIRARGTEEERAKEREQDRAVPQITLWSAINGDVIATIDEPAAARFTYARGCLCIIKYMKRLARVCDLARISECCWRLKQKKKEKKNQRTLLLISFTITGKLLVYALHASYCD